MSPIRHAATERDGLPAGVGHELGVAPKLPRTAALGVEPLGTRSTYLRGRALVDALLPRERVFLFREVRRTGGVARVRPRLEHEQARRLLRSEAVLVSADVGLSPGCVRVSWWRPEELFDESASTSAAVGGT